jgi:hypothetical protein
MATWKTKLRKLHYKIMPRLFTRSIESMREYDAALAVLETARMLCAEIKRDCPAERRTIEELPECPDKDERVVDLILTIEHWLNNFVVDNATMRRRLQVWSWKTLADVDDDTLQRITAAAVEFAPRRPKLNLPTEDYRDFLFSLMVSKQLRDEPPQLWDMTAPQLVELLDKIVAESGDSPWGLAAFPAQRGD